MSFGNGHVPVGTGQQTPYGYHPIVTGYQYTPPPPLATPVVVYVYPEPQPEPVLLILETPAPTLNAVTIYRDGGVPARMIPPGARDAMRARTRYVDPHTPFVVHAQHVADASRIPGHGHGHHGHPGQPARRF